MAIVRRTGARDEPLVVMDAQEGWWAGSPPEIAARTTGVEYHQTGAFAHALGSSREVLVELAEPVHDERVSKSTRYLVLLVDPDAARQRAQTCGVCAVFDLSSAEEAGHWEQLARGWSKKILVRFL